MNGRDPYRAVAAVRLRAGREAAVLRGHPWVYRGALAGPVGGDGRPVEVVSAAGRRLGVALPGGSGGSLALRMITAGGEPWERATLIGRLAAAADLRHRLAIDADAYRLVNAEGDGLPGLVVDRYGAHAVVQPFESAWRPYLGDLADALGELGCTTVLLRPAWPGAGAVATLRGALPEVPVVIREGGARFPVDLVGGQKTGFFLDQRDNRRLVADLAGGLDLLNLFSYSASFAVTALLAGARGAVNVDASREALALAREAYRLNRLPAAGDGFLCGDAFRVARDLAAAGRRFDLVVVDPPAFVKRRRDLRRGLEGYRDINLQALRLIDEGWLVTCSCSALVGDEQLAGALLAASLDAGRELRIVERRGAGPDHPVSLACPETRHLKVLVCHVSTRPRNHG